jgi:GDP-mannose 6-dehydrogenase
VKIGVLGLGYLGSTVAACAVADGHEVLGIDPDPQRWGAMNTGSSPVAEPGLAKLLQLGFADRRITGRPNFGNMAEEADMAIVCVGTPKDKSGTLDLSQVMSLTKEVGMALRSRSAAKPPLALVFRSTLSPGTMDGLILPMLQQTSQTSPGLTYEPCYNPESLREVSAISDYRHPSRIILGERFPGASHRLLGLYDAIDAPIYELPYAAAEVAKLADNSFHALKIAFANELGKYAISVGIDAQLLADVFVSDNKLNISEAYLRPGGPFGGPCLAKDTQALVQAMLDRGLTIPLLSSIIPSNNAHSSFLFRAVSRILPEAAEVLVFGIGFKTGSLDLRDSPAIALADSLIAAGHRVSIHDPDVTDLDKFCARLPPRLGSCWVSDFQRAASHADLIALWKPAPQFSVNAKIFDFRTLGAAGPFKFTGE